MKNDYDQEQHIDDFTKIRESGSFGEDVPISENSNMGHVGLRFFNGDKDGFDYSPEILRRNSPSSFLANKSFEFKSNQDSLDKYISKSDRKPEKFVVHNIFMENSNKYKANHETIMKDFPKEYSSFLNNIERKYNRKRVIKEIENLTKDYSQFVSLFGADIHIENNNVGYKLFNNGKLIGEANEDGLTIHDLSCFSF